MKTALSQYEQQATDFLSRHGLKIAIKLSNTKEAPWQPAGNHYRVTLSKPAVLPDMSANHVTRQNRGMMLGRPSKSLTFDFWGSIADAKKLPQAAKDLQNMQLQIQNTEPHLRVNLVDLLTECEAEVAACHPTAYDVLACISSDVHCPDTFEDFCAAYGYDEDSRKAEQTFRLANTFARKLRAFFTDAEQNELGEIQ